MAGGIFGAADWHRGQGSSIFSNLSNLEAQRNTTNMQLKAQDRQETLGAVGTGAGIGFQVGGPWGALIGAGVGYLASSFL